MHGRLLQKLYCVLSSTKKEMFKKSVEVSTAISLNIGVSILPSKPAKVKEKFPENYIIATED